MFEPMTPAVHSAAKDVVRPKIDYELWCFLCLIVLANTAFILSITHGLLPERLYGQGRFVLLGLVLIGVVSLFRGSEALWDLIRPMAVWRVSPVWYLLALAWAPVMAITVLLVKSAVTGENALSVDSFLFGRPRLFVTVILASFVGEIVWVSYSIGRLSRRYNALTSSLIVGVFWSLWWVPIVILGQGVIPGLPLGGLVVSMLGVAAMCGFVYAKTGSGLVVLLLQVTMNSSLLVFPVLPTTGGLATYWGYSIFYLAAVLLLYWSVGPRSLWKSET
jgi:membrane protease YdiL (CAAX protease family)